MIPRERIKLLRNKKGELEKILPVKIRTNEEVTLESEDPSTLMSVKKVIEAFGRGFNLDTAMNLLDENYSLDIIKVNEFTHSRKRQISLKGRVIGFRGSSKRFIEKMCNIKITVYGKTICIIGRRDRIKLAREAIEMLLNGKKHNTVYRFLENEVKE